MIRVVFNQKGGVGKTTITVNLAAIAASRGLRTLLIDLDPQGNATHYLGGTPGPDGSARFFEGTLSFRHRVGLADCIRPTDVAGLDLVVADPELETLQHKLESRYKIFKLRDALDSLDGWDAVYIDTPPALNFYTRAALIAASGCLIPFDCDAFSRQALYTLIDALDEVKEDHNPELTLLGIVVNQFQARARLPRQLIEELRAEGLPLLEPPLSATVKVRESHQARRPLIEIAPAHKLTAQMIALYEALPEDR